MERYLRQSSLVSESIQSMGAIVIGTGAVGRQVALQLTSTGIGKLHLVDFDTVEEVNLSPQGFFETDLGRKKVDAVGDLCKVINSELVLKKSDSRYRRSMDIPDIVFCCVDSISDREFIHQAVKDKCSLFVDSRLAGEQLRIITAFDKDTHERYEKTIFPESEAYQAPCTAKSTIYSASVTAGLMVGQMAKWSRGFPLVTDVLISLLTFEIDADMSCFKGEE